MKKIKRVSSLVGNGYDTIIIGAGLAGATCAHLDAMKGKRVLLVDRRSHIAGNIYTKKQDDIHVHKYGAHLFHTNELTVWEFLNQFCTFSGYEHKVMAATGKETVVLPFTMVTFMQLFNVQTVIAVKAKILEETTAYFPDGIPENPANFELQAIAIVGTTVYEKLIKHYTEKQWGCKATDLPPEIIKRLPLRWNCDTTYFNNAKWQGIPLQGYTEMVDNMLMSNNIDVLLDCDFLKNKDEILTCGLPDYSFIYTGAIDELFDYEFGHLEYRTVRFVDKLLPIDNFQGTSVVNFTGPEKPYTRTIEHKHFDPNCTAKNTIVSTEYAEDFVPGKNEPYYPIGRQRNKELWKKYETLFNSKYQKGILLGRLATYQYLDMDKVVKQALDLRS